jgi:hypothetical protein
MRNLLRLLGLMLNDWAKRVCGMYFRTRTQSDIWAERQISPTPINFGVRV